jgi:hypothetical protein
MKSLLTICLLCFAIVTARAQYNIVTNPSFETTLSCPSGGGMWNACAGWNNVNMNPGPGSWATPDYFHPCGSGQTAPPSTFSGTCAAQHGSAMMGLVVYNQPFPQYREYLSSQLTCTMQPGKTYTVSFWISNGTGIKSPWTISNIGIHFSGAPLVQSGWGLISATPQLEVTSNVAATNWVNYTFTINPSANWYYITIGAFRADVSNSPVMTYANPGGPTSVYANYFIDNIQVLAPALPVTIMSSSGSATVCAGTNVTLTATGATSYTWSNLATTSSIVVAPSVATVYSVNSCLSTASVAVQTSVCTSVQSNGLFELRVYPDPFIDALTLTGIPDEDFHVELYDHFGRMIFDFKPEKPGPKAEIILPGLNAGIYFLVVSTPASRIFRRVIRQ